MKKEVSNLTRRIIAYAIDVLILNFLILKPFKHQINIDKLFAINLNKEFIIISLSISILTLLYFTLLELTVRQTLGKMITRIYVSSTKKEFTLQQALMRNITKIVTLTLALDVLYAVINKTHQRYFEKLSYTEVLKIKEKK